MSNTKFTKGVWSQSHRKQYTGMYSTQVYDDKGQSICDLNWHAVDEGNGVTSTDREANAQLIAEAPELYKMVEQLTSELAFAIKEANLWRKRLINSSTENEPDLLDGQTCHEAQVLLAKIRGES